MRNLKRALSLGLTAAMISGLMVMGSSAASYADVTSENNVEAIEVLQAVGVMIGDEDGNFNPDQNVTRNEMAVVMANLMEYNVASYKDTSPFTDVPSWAEPYVAACWTNGITAGYSSTIYGGSDTVTTAQAALMLMKALGYFQYASDFGSDWQLATTRQGNAIDLFNGVDSGVTQAMTRNDVAQLVLNTLKSGTVEASTDGSWTIGDVTINTNVSYSYITSNQPYADAISEDQSTSGTTDASRSIVELGEQLYMGDLKLNDEATDVFGRPARYWEYGGDEIGTYAKTELLRETYTTEVTGRDLYNLLGSATIDDYDFAIYVDGETDEDVLTGRDFAGDEYDYYFTEGNLVRTNTNAVGGTDNGVLTEVYVDTDAREVTIAIINTYLAETDDYDDDDDELDLRVYAIDEKDDDIYVKDVSANPETMTVAGEDFDIADYVDGDPVMVTVADGEVQTIADPEILDAVILSAFRVDSYVTSEGTRYDYASTLAYDDEVLDAYTDGGDSINLKDITYNLILDPYGYLLGIEQNEDPNQYLFLTGLDTNSSNLGSRTADANVIFTDGTMATVEVNLRDSEAANDREFVDFLDDILDENLGNIEVWCSYTVNSNDVYTLDVVESGNAFDDDDDSAAQARYYHTAADATDVWYTIDAQHPALSGVERNGNNIVGDTDAGVYSWVYGNDESVYIAVELDRVQVNAGNMANIISDVNSVVTGIDNANLDVFTGAAIAADPDLGDGASAQGVYTLFGDDGYVIAAIVVGEVAGSTEDYAFVISDSVSREEYGNDGDQWRWSREVVINGEVTEISYVGDSLDVIGTSGARHMDQGTWYEVKYYSDGTVRSATAVGNDAYATVNGAIQAVFDGEDTVLLDTTTGIDRLELSGSTLYAWGDNNTSAQRAGVRVSEDVTVVRTWDVDNDPYADYEEYEGLGGLEDAIDDLDESADRLIAIIEDGRATSIILVGTDVDVDEGEGVSDGTLTLGSVSYNDVDDRFEVEVTTSVALQANVDTYTVTISQLDGDEEYVLRSVTSNFSEDKAANETFDFWVPYGAVVGTGNFKVTVTVYDDSADATYIVEGNRVVA